MTQKITRVLSPALVNYPLRAVNHPQIRVIVFAYFFVAKRDKAHRNRGGILEKMKMAFGKNKPRGPDFHELALSRLTRINITGGRRAPFRHSYGYHKHGRFAHTIGLSSFKTIKYSANNLRRYLRKPSHVNSFFRSANRRTALYYLLHNTLTTWSKVHKVLRMAKNL